MTDQVRLSRKMSYLLRHDSEFTRDRHGWSSVSEVARMLKVTSEDIVNVVDNDGKRRYELRGNLVRAVQGHSVEVDLSLVALTPPAVLYHGTSTHAITSILKFGLNSGQRRYVHLSSSEAEARVVGARHGKPVVLRISAHALSRSGQEFFCAHNDVWLTSWIAPEFISDPVF